MKKMEYKEFLLKYLSQICCVILIITLFIGKLFVYGEKYGRYTEKYGIAGYSLIFNVSSFYAFLLLLVPLILLFGHHIERIKNQQLLIKFVAPMLSLAVLIVMKFNLRDLISIGNTSNAAFAVSFNSGFGFSGWLYLLANLILIALGIIDYFKLNVNKETIKKSIEEKNINILK